MKCALILITGDRIDYIDQSISSCEQMIHSYDSNIEIDVYLVSYDNLEIKSKKDIHYIEFNRPSKDDIDLFPRSIQQIQNFSNDIEQSRRISLGHFILFGGVPNSIFDNYSKFIEYDLIFKSRSDLIFDFNKSDIDKFNPDRELLTFECFWGGCRYNPNFTNDQLIFGKSKDVLDVISYKIQNCILDKFWNPEQYMTYLFTKSNKTKVQISTDKYYLLSKDRESRKWIGFPLEKIKNEDLIFLQKIGVDINKIKFINEYE